MLNKFLLDQLDQDTRVVLTIDEAQNLPHDTLEEVRMLSNLQTDAQMLLQVLLVGQPEFKTRIQKEELSQLAQRVAVNYHLEALDQAESLAYIQHRFSIAGRDDAIFTDSALEQIYQASKGIPRNINLICDSALVYGFGYEMQSIGTEVINQVLADKNKIGLECIQPSPSQPVATAGTGITFNRNIEILIQKKLKLFESQLVEFQRKVQRRVSDLTNKVDNLQNQLTNSLTELVQAERKRNGELLIKNQQLNQQYDKLKKKHQQTTNNRNNHRPIKLKANE